MPSACFCISLGSRKGNPQEESISHYNSPTVLLHAWLKDQILLTTCGHCQGPPVRRGQTQNIKDHHFESTQKDHASIWTNDCRHGFSSLSIDGGLVRSLADTNDRNPTLPNNKDMSKWEVPENPQVWLARGANNDVGHQSLPPSHLGILCCWVIHEQILIRV